MATEREKPKLEVVTDVTAEQIARVYAQAFLSATEKTADISGVVAELVAIVDVLDRVPRLEEVFRSALISHEEKEQLLDRVFRGRSSALVLNFLKVLSKHGRLGLLRPIARQVKELDEKRRGVTEVEVRVARELAGDIQREIEDRIRRALATEPVLRVSVEPELIAGIWVRVGDRVFDGSLRTQLEHARRAMIEKATELIETQPHRFMTAAG